MSWWDEFTNPINRALNSSAFKTIFPVQALAQGATHLATGLKPADQYASGAAGGTILGGAGAFMGSSAMAPYMPSSAPNMGMAGSTLGGNLSPSAGAASGGAGSFSPMSAANMLSSMRGGSPQIAPQESTEQLLARIYQMFPHLRPSFGAQGGIHGA